MNKSLLFLLTLFVCSCLRGMAADTTIKVLFIGNSLTYTNELPEMVQEIGLADSIKVETVSRCLPNYSLEDHWQEGAVQNLIREGGFNYVVVQQGPSAMPSSQELLISYTKKIAAACKEAHAKLCVFTVWPPKQRSVDLEAVIASYKNAAKQTHSILAPAGLAWKVAWQKNPALQLYGPDDFHPSLKGSWLSAFIICAALQGKTELSFISSFKGSWQNDLTKEELQLFQTVIADVLSSAF